MKTNLLNMKSKLRALAIQYKNIIIPILFVLLLPPTAGCILGFEYREQIITHVPFAVVDNDNSKMSRELIEKINTNDAFNVQGYGQNDKDIEDWIESGQIVAGMIIPRDFSADMLEGKAPKILVVYDGAQMSMAGQVKSKISEILGTIRIGYLLQVMEGNLNMTPAEARNYLQPIAHTNRFLGNPTQSVPYFFLQGILANMTQIAVFILGLEMTRYKEKRFLTLCKKAIFAALLGTLSLLITIWMQTVFFTVPFKGSIIGAAVLIFLDMICIANLGIFIRIFIENKLTCLEFAALVMATLMLAGYTFPTIAMPDIFQKISVYTPFTYLGPTLRDVALLGTGFQQAWPSICRLTGMVIFTWLVLLVICQSSGISSIFKNALSRLWKKEVHS